MVTRSRPDSVSTKWSATYASDSGGSGVVQSESSSTVKWTNSVTFGDNIPGWRDNLRRGLPATTSMVGSKIEYRLTTGLLKCRRFVRNHASGIDSVTVIGSLGLNPTPPSGDPATLSISGADSQALGKFNRRIIEVNTAFKGGIFLGELAQTLRTIKNPAQGLRRAADDWRAFAQRLRAKATRSSSLRGGNSVRDILNRTTENLADAWLEAQYGWRPLLSDIDDGCKALAILKSGQSLHTGRVTAKAEVVGNPVVSESGTTASIASWYNTVSSVSRCQVIYRGAVRVEPVNPVQMRAELLGFNPASWLPTVWELIPYSFLIDYFSNVGEIVEGWSALFTRLAWCNRTVRSSYEHSWSARSNDPSMKINGAYFTTFVPAKGVCTKSYVSRQKFEGTSVPDFRLEIPGMGSLKWLNIAALITARNADRKWSFGD